MSTVAVLNAIAAGLPLIAKIVEWAEQGMSTEEIQRRLADPTGVGKDLIDRIRERQRIGRDLLGRDPNP